MDLTELMQEIDINSIFYDDDYNLQKELIINQVRKHLNIMPMSDVVVFTKTPPIVKYTDVPLDVYLERKKLGTENRPPEPKVVKIQQNNRYTESYFRKKKEIKRKNQLKIDANLKGLDYKKIIGKDVSKSKISREEKIKAECIDALNKYEYWDDICPADESEFSIFNKHRNNFNSKGNLCTSGSDYLRKLKDILPENEYEEFIIPFKTKRRHIETLIPEEYRTEFEYKTFCWTSKYYMLSLRYNHMEFIIHKGVGHKYHLEAVGVRMTEHQTYVAYNVSLEKAISIAWLYKRFVLTTKEEYKAGHGLTYNITEPKQTKSAEPETVIYSSYTELLNAFREETKAVREEKKKKKWEKDQQLRAERVELFLQKKNKAIIPKKTISIKPFHFK